MSDTFRKAALNRLPRLPPTRAPWADEPPSGAASGPAGGDVDEGEEELADDIGSLSASLPQLSKKEEQDLSPLSASGFFAQALEVTPPSASGSTAQTTFRVYISPPTASPAGQADSGKGKQTYLICHHGAGSSGLSFAALAKDVTEIGRGELGVLAFDSRGHGKTRTSPPEEETDLSADTLREDLLGVLRRTFPESKEAPALLLLGHSMGACPILAAAPILQADGYQIPGVIVLDVVEGTAVEALPLMKTILGKRPTSFMSVVDGIHWHLSSGSIRNTVSARVSVPSYLVPDPRAGEGSTKQVWRTNLLATEPYWQGWYDGLSRRFIGAKCARLLVLAGQERLDKELMVGQMQGKFQLEVMQNVGHYLHEDDPAKLAETIVTFWRRNTRVLILPPKIGTPGAAGLLGVKRVGED